MIGDFLSFTWKFTLSFGSIWCQFPSFPNSNKVSQSVETI